jgi:hypothetical protein
VTAERSAEETVDELKLSVHANRLWAQKTMKMWSLVFPLLVFGQPLSQALRTGNWWPFVILVAIFAPVLFLIWKLRQAMGMLIEVEEIDFKAAKLERADEAERLQRRLDRRKRAEARLARLHHEQEMRTRDRAIQDLVGLAERLGSDTPPDTADT